MFTFINSLLELIWGALSLEPSIFRLLYEVPNIDLLALVVLVLAMFSETVGQSVVLFLNQVRPRRFLISIIMAVLIAIAGIALWTLVTWILGLWLFKIEPTFRQVLIAVAIGQSPLIFGFAVLIPYFGLFIRLTLRVWVLLAVTVALTALGIPVRQVLVISFGGWLVVEALNRLLDKPLDVVGDWIWYLATGQREHLELPQWVEQIYGE
jgi:hypothetical protein